MAADRDSRLRTGARLRRWRKERGWDKPQLAREIAHALGESRPDHKTLVSYVKRWEAGKIGISERYRLALSRAFGIPEAQLFPGVRAVTGSVLPAKPYDAGSSAGELLGRACRGDLLSDADRGHHVDDGPGFLDRIERLLFVPAPQDLPLSNTKNVTMEHVLQVETANLVFRRWDNSFGGGLPAWPDR